VTERGARPNATTTRTRVPKAGSRDPGTVQPTIHIFSDDQVWAWLCAQHIAARGAMAETDRLQPGAALKIHDISSSWLIVDFDTYSRGAEETLLTAYETIRPFSKRTVIVIAKGWPRAARQLLPSDEVVIRHPDMRILVRNMLSALASLGCQIPYARAET